MDLLEQALNQLAPKKVGIQEFSESSDFCGKNLFPAQTVLLKLIFLEELTGPEEDILNYWIEGGRNGTEIMISPNVRERVEWLRENDYPHFREVALVGGRRSSKGFMTGLAMASVMWSCYDDKTEVLTNQGWRLFADLSENDLMATLSKEGFVEYQKPIKLIQKEYDGVLLTHENKSLNFSVTPNHRMLVDHAEKHRRTIPFFVPAADLTRIRQRVIPKTASLSRTGTGETFILPTPENKEHDKITRRPLPLKGVAIEDFAAFIGFWLAEGEKIRIGDGGTGFGVAVYQSKPRGIEWLESLLLRLDWPYVKRGGSKRAFAWEIQSWELREYLVKLQDGELHLPQGVLTQWPQSALESLLEGLLVGDGNWSEKNQRYTGFFNTSRRLIDEVQGLLTHVGLTGNIIRTHKAGRVNYLNGRKIEAKKDCYRLTISARSDVGYLQTKEIYERPYVGKVYCAVVPNQTLFVRRKGVSMWCGNTLQLQDPGTYYGIDPEKEIHFSCIAGSQEQSRGRQYADFSATVGTCKAFDPYIVKSLENEIRVATNVDLRRIAQEKGRGNRMQKDIARLRGSAMAANSGTIRGLAMMVYAIDEIAHMLPGESKSSPNKIYEAANPSLGQFGVDGLAFLNSSPYTKIGLFYEKYVEGLLPFDSTGPVDEPIPLLEDGIDLNRNGEPRLLVFQFGSWHMYEGYQKSKNRAKLKSALMGSPDWDLDETDESGEPLWSDKDKQLSRAARAEEQANPEGFKVEYRGKFAEVMDAYMEPRRIDEMFAGLPSEWVYDENSENPEVPRLLLQPFATNTGKDATNMYRYKFHLDPSSTTAGFGFAIAHTEKFTDWKGVDEDHVVFDLIKRWQPQKFAGHVIRWTAILDEVMKYAEFFFPFEITMDQFQSNQPVQELTEKLSERNISTRVYIKPAPQPLDARVLTPKGWTTMGALEMGDRVIGRDGTSHQVTGVYPQGVQDVYRIRLTDGSSTECTLDHIWRVKSHGERGVFQTLPLKEIVERGIVYESGSKKWEVPYVDPVEFDVEEDLPIDPYLFGSLLGDGCFHKSVSMAVASEDADEQEGLLTSLLPDGVTVSRRDHGGWNKLYFKRPKGAYRNPLSESIRMLGLWYVTGPNKFIPKRYLHASIEDRLSLLQGLMDTDGSVSTTQYRVRFCTTSRALAQGVVELVGSLGGSATVEQNEGRNTMNISIRWLPAGFVPFRLQRKAKFYKQNRRNYRHIESVELIGQKDTQCIRVDSDEHLYVTDDFIVTHNTAELNWKRWEVCKTSIYAKLVHAPNDTEDARWCAQELKFLQIQGGTSKYPRVDKQEIGPVQTKDCADCVAECVNTLIGNQISNRTRERLSTSAIYGGAEGGYGIGFSGTGPKGGAGPEGISEHYSSKERKAQQMYENPARGVLSRRGGNRRGSNRARW